MSEHTPGPWEFWNERANGDDTLNIQTTDRGELIAMVDTDWALPITGGNHTANARLVAAAPDLLAACEALFAACDKEFGDDPIWSDDEPVASVRGAGNTKVYSHITFGMLRRARAAIARAKGTA